MCVCGVMADAGGLDVGANTLSADGRWLTEIGVHDNYLVGFQWYCLLCIIMLGSLTCGNDISSCLCLCMPAIPVLESLDIVSR